MKTKPPNLVSPVNSSGQIKEKQFNIPGFTSLEEYCEAIMRMP